jgi:hypothetical protein
LFSSTRQLFDVSCVTVSCAEEHNLLSRTALRSNQDHFPHPAQSHRHDIASSGSALRVGPQQRRPVLRRTILFGSWSSQDSCIASRGCQPRVQRGVCGVRYGAAGSSSFEYALSMRRCALVHRFIALSLCYCERWPGVLTAARVAQSLCCKTAAFGRLATTQADALATTAGRSHTPTRTLLHPNHRHHQPQEHLIPNSPPVPFNPIPPLHSPPVPFNPIPPLPQFNRRPYLVVLKAFAPCTSHRFHAGAVAVMRLSFQANSFRSDAHALACSRDGRWLSARATNRNSLRVRPLRVTRHHLTLPNPPVCSPGANRTMPTASAVLKCPPQPGPALIESNSSTRATLSALATANAGTTTHP